MDELPNRRQKIRGMDGDDRRVELSFSIAPRLYRCPSCRRWIDVGAEHVLVKYPDGHQHWHFHCARHDILRTLRRKKVLGA